jgi:hypothetical protein
MSCTTTSEAGRRRESPSARATKAARSVVVRHSGGGPRSRGAAGVGDRQHPQDPPRVVSGVRLIPGFQAPARNFAENFRLFFALSHSAVPGLAATGSRPSPSGRPHRHSQTPHFAGFWPGKARKMRPRSGRCYVPTNARLLWPKLCEDPRKGDAPVRKLLAVVVAGALAVSAPAAAFGSPQPPTNGGNGAGQSGQCTGNPDDRPASCQSATNKGP